MCVCVGVKVTEVGQIGGLLFLQMSCSFFFLIKMF